MANTDYQDKLSLFHSFSKTPVVSTLGLGNAINKSGHTVSSTEVWSDEIPYFGILSAVSDLESKVAPYAAKNDICKVGSTYYIRNGVEYSAGKTTAELWDTITLTDGLILKNRFDKDVIKYHSGKQLSDLTGDNNANTDSNHYAARLWTSEGLIEQFVGPTDKALNGLASVGYTPTVYNNGTKIVEGTDYSMVTFSGTVLWNTQHNSGTRTIDCFEYIGAKVSESITGINETIKNLSIQAGAGIGVSVDGNEASTGIHNIEFKKSDEITISQSTDGAKTDITIGVDLSNVENAIKANEIKVADGSGLTIDKAVDGSGTTIGVDTSVLATKSSVDGVADDLAALTTTVGKNKVLAGNGISVSEGENGTTVSADTTVVATKSSVDTVAGNVATLTDTVNSNKVTTTTGSGIIIGSATTTNGTPLSIDTSVIATKSTVDALTSRVENLENVKLDVVVLGTSDALPTGEDIRVNTIYLKQDSNAADGSYIEYIGYMNGSTKAIEKIGSTKIDLDGYVKTIKVNGTNYNVGSGTTTVDIGKVVRNITGGIDGQDYTGSPFMFNEGGNTVSAYIAVATESNIGVASVINGTTSVTDQTYASYQAISANAFEANKAQTNAAITNVETTVSNNYTALSDKISINYTALSNLISNNYTVLSGEISGNYTALSDKINGNYTVLSNLISSNYTTLSDKIGYNFTALSEQIDNVRTTANSAVQTIKVGSYLNIARTGSEVNITVDDTNKGDDSGGHNITNKGVTRVYYGDNASGLTYDYYKTIAASLYTVAIAYDAISSKLNSVTSGSITEITPTGAITATKSNNTVTVGVKSASDTQEGVTKLFSLTYDTLAGTENGAASTSTVKSVYDAVTDAITDLNESAVKSVKINGTSHTPSAADGSIDLGSGFIKGVSVYNSASDSASAIEAYVDDANNIVIAPKVAIINGSLGVTSEYGVIKAYYGNLSYTEQSNAYDKTVVPSRISVENALRSIWNAALLKTDTTYTKGVKVGANTYNATDNVVALPNLVNEVYTNDVTGLTNGVANSIVAGSVDDQGKVKIAAVAATDKQAGVTTLHTVTFDGLSTSSATGAASVETIKNLKSGLETEIDNVRANKISYLVAGNAIELGYTTGANNYTIHAKDATSTDKGVMKLYSTSTNATDGTVTAAVVDTIKGQVEQLMNIAHLQVKVVTTLPEGEAITANTLYLIKETGSIDTYVEYISYKANESDTNFSLERIGTTKTDLNGFASTITVNGQTNTVTNNSVNLGNIVRGISTSSSALTLGGTNESGITIDVKGASASQAGVAKLFTLTPATLGAEGVSSAYAGAASVATVSDFYKEIHQTVETLYLSNSNKISSNYTALSDAIAAVKTTADGAIQTISTTQTPSLLTITKDGTNVNLNVEYATSTHGGVVDTYTYTAAQISTVNDDDYKDVPTIKTVQNIYNELDATKLDEVTINGSRGIVGSVGGVNQAFKIVATNDGSKGDLGTIDTSANRVKVNGWGLTAYQKDEKTIIHDGFIGSSPSVGLPDGKPSYYVLPKSTYSVIGNFVYDSSGNVIDTIRTDRFFDNDYMFDNVYSSLAYWCADLSNANHVSFSTYYSLDASYAGNETITPLKEFTGDLSSAKNVSFAGCSSLTSFIGDISSMEYSYGSFANCASLVSVVSDFSSLRHSNRMFANCTSLKEISADFTSYVGGSNYDFIAGAVNLETFNGSLESLVNGEYMFKGMSKLKSVTTNLKKLENAYQMFANCASLTSFIGDTSSMTSADSMFFGCLSLSTVNMDMGSLISGVEMFNNCSSLTSLGGDLHNLQNGGRMFYGCYSLTSFSCELSSLTYGVEMFKGCKLDLSSVQNIANTVVTHASSTSITIGVDASLQGNADLATAIATIESKNWIVTVEYN